LKRKTSQTGGIASSTNRQRGFPPLKEQVLGCKTMVFSRTIDQVLNKGPCGISPFIFLYCRKQFPVIIIPWIPLVIIFYPEPGSPVLAVLEAHCRIGPGRKDIRLWSIVHGRKMASNQSWFEKSGYRLTLRNDTIDCDLRHGFVFPCCRVKADRRTVRYKEELAEFRHRNEIVLSKRSGDGP
jgi:hypothetical protein